jgi:hypothetical protein
MLKTDLKLKFHPRLCKKLIMLVSYNGFQSLT